MSFLDSVLSSIGTGGSSQTSVQPKVVPTKKPDPPIVVSVKRKAEEELRRDVDRPAKVERPNPPKAQDRPSKPPQPRTSNVAQSTNASIAAPAPAASNKNPKKGSFAAIMAKAKAAQAEPAKVTGTITHKPKEKTRSRKDLIMEREEAKKAAKKGVPLKGSQGRKDIVNVKKNGTEPAIPSTTKPGYQGTMKPAKAGYQGTGKPTSTSSYTGTSKQGYAGTAARGPSGNHLSASKQAGRRRVEYDDSDEDGSEDQDDYESDLSDMDAGFDDMEEEEEQAERIARKEDLAAQAELDRLKREKERKKALYSKGK